MLQQKIDKVLDRFDKRDFRLDYCDYCDGLGRIKINLLATAPSSELCPKCKGYGVEEKGREVIKSFISQSIRQVVAESFEETRGERIDTHDFICNPNEVSCLCRGSGFNQALSEQKQKQEEYLR